MDRNIIDLGFLQIKWYSVCILLAIISAVLIIVKESKKKKVPEEYLMNSLFYGVLIGILGARVYYVLFNLDYYLTSPLEIFMIWNGGLAIHGALISTLIFLIWYSKRNNINVLLMLDIIVVGLILAQSIGRWGNFFNQEAYGRVISLSTLKSLHLPAFIINGMYIDNAYHEPTFLYESVLSFLGFIALISIRHLRKIRVGQLLGIYLIWYGTERFIIESMRLDSLMLGSIRMAQLVSLIGVAIGLYFLMKNIKTKNYYHKAKINLNKEES